MSKRAPKSRTEVPVSFSLIEQARALGPKAFKELEAILNSKRAAPSVKLKAIDMILDRGYGKTPINVQVANTLDDDTLRRLSEAILEQRGIEPAAPKVIEAKLLTKNTAPKKDDTDE